MFSRDAIGSNNKNKKNPSLREEVFFSANRCPPVPELEYSVPDSYSTEDGSEVKFSCVEGYVLPGNITESMMTCQNGIWNYTKSFGCEGRN